MPVVVLMVVNEDVLLSSVSAWFELDPLGILEQYHSMLHVQSAAVYHRRIVF